MYIYSQALRLRRICSDNNTLQSRLEEYSQYFILSGYDKSLVHNQMNRVIKFTQKETLEGINKQTPSSQANDKRAVFVTTFNPHSKNIAQLVKKRWNLLQSKTRLQKIFGKSSPLMAYRRPKSLRDILVSAKIRSPSKMTQETGLNPCNKPRCSWCPYMIPGNKFQSLATGQKFKLLHTLNCKSQWVIYAINCLKCKKQYVGKCETGLNIRLNNHRNHVKNKVRSCELAEHFINNEDHNFDRDITISVIEQLKKLEMNVDKKKAILKVREIFWMHKLNTFQPLGLNKRIG